MSLSAWDANSPLSAAQRQALASLEALSTGDVAGQPAASAPSPSLAAPSRSQAVQPAAAAQTRQIQALTAVTTRVASILHGIDTVAAEMDNLSTRYRTVAARSSELRDACEEILAEKTMLLSQADRLYDRLQHFDTADRLSQQVAALPIMASSTVATPTTGSLDNAVVNTAIPLPQLPAKDFLVCLQRLDETLLYFQGNASVKDVPTYQQQFRGLHAKVTSALAHHFHAALQAVSSRVLATTSTKASSAAAAARPSTATPGPASALAATSLLEFRVVAATLRPIFSALHQWTDPDSVRRASVANSTITLVIPHLLPVASTDMAHLPLDHGLAVVSVDAYRQMSRTCLTHYYAQRFPLVAADVNAHMRLATKTGGNILDMLRSTCLFLIHLCGAEYQLFYDFFTPSATTHDTLAELLESAAETYYSYVRPWVLKLTDVEVLCDAAVLLQHDLLEEQVRVRGEECTAVGVVLQRIVRDVHERLVYRSQAFVRSHVSGYAPTAADVLPRAPRTIASGGSPESASPAGASAEAEKEAFPTVALTLNLLAKLAK